MAEKFDLDDIESILKMLAENDVREFRLERGEEKIWLKRGAQQERRNDSPPAFQHVFTPMTGGLPVQTQVSSEQVVAHAAAPVQQPAPVVSGNSAGHVAKPEPTNNYYEVASPMVGTFYRRPAVDADSYFDVGDTVKKGDVLCIVEAMKLMNEIESDVSGKIVEICLDDGQMAEYGEVLFRIDTGGA